MVAVQVLGCHEDYEKNYVKQLTMPKKGINYGRNQPHNCSCAMELLVRTLKFNIMKLI